MVHAMLFIQPLLGIRQRTYRRIRHLPFTLLCNPSSPHAIWMEHGLASCPCSMTWKIIAVATELIVETRSESQHRGMASSMGEMVSWPSSKARVSQLLNAPWRIRAHHPTSFSARHGLPSKKLSR
jgi:hypothetical protein